MIKSSLVWAPWICGCTDCDVLKPVCLQCLTAGLWYILNICQSHSCVVGVNLLCPDLANHAGMFFSLLMSTGSVIFWHSDYIPAVCLGFLFDHLLLKCTIRFLSLGGYPGCQYTGYVNKPMITDSIKDVLLKICARREPSSHNCTG